MNFLKKLATPFIALWRWIKETAWVQPLLIVGCIFAVIFSIPYIVKGFQSLGTDSSDHMKYFEKNKLGLEDAYKGESKADKFFELYKEAVNDEAKKTEFEKTYGNKFFFTFVQESCESCANLKEGLEALNKDWTNKVTDGSTFKYYSIVADTKFEDDENYENYSPFGFILQNNSGFFEELIAIATKTDYYSNLTTEATTYKEKITKYAEVNDLANPSVDTPMTIVFDTSKEDLISNIFFGVEGENSVDRSIFLANAWNSQEQFGPNYNK